MPQLLMLVAIGAGAYFGTRWVRNKAAQFNRNLQKAAKARQSDTPPSHANEDIAELKKDPVTGVYRVEED